MVKLTINSKESLSDAIKTISDKWEEKKHLTIEIIPNQRTLTQNKAIHVYFKLLADAFNRKQLDVSDVLSKPVDMPWSDVLVKGLIWHRIQKAQYGIDSTTELNVNQISEIYEIINRFTATRFGISVEFPNKDNK